MSAKEQKEKQPQMPYAHEEEVIHIHRDDRNYRKHNKRNLDLIDRSVTRNGVGRPIFADNSGKVIGGNGTLEITEKHCIPKRIIHTDGSELIVVVRDDVSPDDPRRAELAIMDNSTTDSSEFDFELLQSDFDNLDLADMGIEVSVETETNEPQQIDLSESYEVVVECESEEEQQNVFEKLTGEGMKCRLLTL